MIILRLPVPEAFVTVTEFVPATVAHAMVAVIVVLLSIVKLEAFVEPNLTAVVPVKLLPIIVITEPVVTEVILVPFNANPEIVGNCAIAFTNVKSTNIIKTITCLLELLRNFLHSNIIR